MWDKGEIHFLVKHIIHAPHSLARIIYTETRGLAEVGRKKKIAHAMCCSFKTKKKLRHEDSRCFALFDIPLKVVYLLSTETHLQMIDTGVRLIWFSRRSETSGTKARFLVNSGADVRDVSKVFTETLYFSIYRNTLLSTNSGYSVLMAPERASGHQPHHCIRAPI